MGGDDEDDEDEVDPALGMVYYLTTRALFDQMVFIRNGLLSYYKSIV